MSYKYSVSIQGRTYLWHRRWLLVIFMPPQAMHGGGYYVFTVSMGQMSYANKDSSTGWASPLQTCSSRGIVWPCSV